MQLEGLSDAYLRAVAATAGCSLAKPWPDDHKVDWTVRWLGATDIAAVDIQLKATATDPGPGDELRYWCDDLELYELLRRPRQFIPRILVLTVAAVDTEDWLVARESYTTLGCQAYWVSLRGLPAVDNRTGATIRIPKSQAFTPGALGAMMDKAMRQEWL